MPDRQTCGSRQTRQTRRSRQTRSSPSLFCFFDLPRSMAAMHILMASVCLLLFSVPARAQTGSDGNRATVNEVLTSLHKMASEADWGHYFDLYTDSSIFMGTDATERWSKDEFKGYASKSSGWTYVMTERHIFISDDGRTAWFDELLENNNLGLTRGTGVLIKQGTNWRISQYNLTIPVPNQLSRKFVAEIRGLSKTGN